MTVHPPDSVPTGRPTEPPSAGLTDAFARVYRDLSQAAARHLRGDGTLDAPAVVGEVYLRLAKHGGPWNDTGHVYAVACRAAGQVVANYHRDRSRQRRGGGVYHVTLNADVMGGGATVSVERFLDLQRALGALEQKTPRLAQVVAYRAVAGLSVEETAEALGVGTATVKRDWRVAKAFVARFLAEGP